MRKFSVIAAGLIYGIWDFSLKKYASTGTYSLFGIAIMELVAGLLLLAFFFFGNFWLKTKSPINTEGFFWVFLGGICIAIANVLYCYALERLALFNAGAIYVICEFSIIVIFGLLILKEDITVIKVAGLIMGALALILLNWDG